MSLFPFFMFFGHCLPSQNSTKSKSPGQDEKFSVKTMVPIDLPIEKQTFCSHRATVRRRFKDILPCAVVQRRGGLMRQMHGRESKRQRGPDLKIFLLRFEDIHRTSLHRLPGKEKSVAAFFIAKQKIQYLVLLCLSIAALLGKLRQRCLWWLVNSKSQPFQARGKSHARMSLLHRRGLAAR
jgi:hypothetical protein